jgi:ParB/RepB/Spo0J family partition protein
MALAACSPRSPTSGTAASAAAGCAEHNPSAAASAASANGERGLGLETLSQLMERMEGPEGDWWQMLVFGFAACFEDVPIDRPRLALWAIDRRIRETAEICTTTHRPHEELGYLIHDLATAEQAVLDEFDLFYQGLRAEPFTDEITPPETDEMATKTANRSQAPKSAPEPEADAQVLLRSLNWNESVWNRLRAMGANDHELRHEISERYELAVENGGPGTRSYRTRGGNEPAIWYDELSSGRTGLRPPDLAGDELVARVRTLLSIPQPAKRGKAGRNGVHKTAQNVNQTGPEVTETGPAVNDRSDDEITKGLELVTEGMVPLDRIDTSPYQTKHDAAPEWVAEIAASMQADGQHEAIHLREMPGDRFQLLGGHTRLLAARSIKWKGLRSRVYRCDDTTAARLVHELNAKHKELTVLDKARGLKKILDVAEAQGKSQRQVADELGVSQSNISNQVRLLDLPEAFQQRLLAGELTIDQARKLSRWASRPKVLDGFLKHAENCGLKTGPIDNHHFESCLHNGLRRASRTMTKRGYGESCDFTPTPEQREQLEIEDVPASWGGGTEKRAFNLALYNKLQKAARDKKKAKAESTAKQRTQAPQRDTYMFTYRRNESWLPAYQEAIRKALAGKKSKADVSRLSRLALFFRDSDASIAQVMAMSTADYEAWQFGEVVKLFGPKCRVYDLDDLQELATYLGVDAAAEWKPTKEMLAECTAQERAAIAEELGVAADTGSIIKAFPRAEIPELFLLEQPKKKAGRKK